MENTNQGTTGMTNKMVIHNNKAFIEIEKITEGMHPYHVGVGYYILRVADFYYQFCGSLMLNRYNNLEDCIKGFNGKQ